MTSTESFRLAKLYGSAASVHSRLTAYVELTKPRITWLILMSTAIGYHFGSQSEISVWRALHTMAGTGLVSSGTATLNQWYEREIDGQMQRTRMRPLPSGRLASSNALLFGIALALLGALELGVEVNRLSSTLAISTVAIYLLLYTPLKQSTPWCTAIGAFAGAMPPLIGYAAAAGKLAPQAWVLYAILFVWQLPHLYAIAWMHREDYSRGGIKLLPVIDPNGKWTALHILGWSLLLIPVSLLPSRVGIMGESYLPCAIALGVFSVYLSVRMLFNPVRNRARGVFLGSIIYLPSLYCLMLFASIGR